ncbi:MAG: phosphomannomutase/phosphoglucomutase [Eubacterium sp.]|nr:phosphomannomutase/phosphoglucomutase [Eubacterium sp.]
MLSEKYRILKSGTDIRGIASEGVEGESVNLTDEVVCEIAGGFALWLEKKCNKKSGDLTVAVGRDCRISGEHIADLVINTLIKYGVKVYDCALSSTPAMFMTTVDLGCDAAVQITASHHPFNRNGLKFFIPSGGLDHGDIIEILEYAESRKTPETKETGTVIAKDYMSAYCRHLCDFIKKEVNAKDYEHPLRGFKIVVDAGNGVGGFYERDVLRVLGADTKGSRYLEPDGTFPNHVPNPENKEAMKSICDAVLESGADLGIIFDTDVDRGGAVDSDGNEINRNRLVALASCIALENNPGGTIVTDSVTSSGLAEFIEQHLGGKHLRFRRGYKNVINKAIELKNSGINAPLAIETSGHAAMEENYYLDDGAYLCTKIIVKAAQLRQEGKTLSSLLTELKEPAEATEIRIKISDTDFKTTGEGIISSLEKYAKEQSGWEIVPDSYEGIRINFDKNNGDGWLLLRLSVHDPILPLNIESNQIGGVEIIKEKIMCFLKTQNGIVL